MHKSNKKAIIYVVIGLILGFVFSKAVNVKIEIHPKLKKVFSRLRQSSVSVKNEPIRDVLELCYFERKSDLQLIENNKVKKEQTNEKATQGKYSLKCIFTDKGNNVSFYSSLPRNWAEYKYLRFDVYSEEDGIPLSLFIADKVNISYYDRYNKEGIPLNKGWNNVKISISEIDKKLILDRINHLNIFLWKVPGEHTLYFDNIRLVSKEDTSNQSSIVAFSELAAAKEASDLSSLAKEITVNIYPEKVLTRVSSMIYGSNLVPRNESDFKIRGFLKYIGITCLRFPGGASPGWRWKSGEADFVPHMKNMPLADINYLINFCKATNTQLIIQVNVESGTPQEAAELVEYLNKKICFKVEYWELGNEVYGDWDKAHTTPQKYAELIKKYSKAMKAVDADIKIGVDWGGRYYDPVGWDQTLIKLAADYIDFVSVHWYPNHINKTHEYQGRIHPTPKEVMSNSMEVPNIVKRVNNIIERYAPHRKGKVEIAFLEWDGSWDAPAYDPGPQYVQGAALWSLANAIFYADCLGQFAQNGITVSAHYDLQECMFGLIRGWDPAEGSGGRKWDQRIVRPKAYAIKLFSEHFGDYVIKSEVVDSPYYYKSEDWWADSYQGNVPYISCYASKFNENNKLGIILINKNPEKDFELSILIDENTKLKGYSDIWILSGPDIMSQNDGQPDSVKISRLEQREIDNNFKYTIPKHSVVAMEIELL
ncbi:hypothetical protein ACFL4C_01565 [Candidatus Omnitrophota bacterium]